MKRKFLIIVVLMLLVTTTFSTLQSAYAQGPFDMQCPNCRGTGEISCGLCSGKGQISTTSTCSICHGSGQTTVWKTCVTCSGLKKIQPTISRKSTSGWGTLSGFDWVARVQGVFHNEEDTGTYGVAKSEVHTVTTNYYHSSPRTYFAPHTDVTITIDTPEITVGTDWTYTIYISSKDDITCPSCNGSGGKSVVETCNECNGKGTVAATQTCVTCNGTGSLECTRCDGRGYITNQAAVNLAIIGIAVVIIGSILGVTAFAMTKRKRLAPTK